MRMTRNETKDDEPPSGLPRVWACGFRLSERMEELGLSGAELARRVGIGARQLNYYVRGDRTPDLVTAKKIAGLLRITLDDLVDPKRFLSHRDDRTAAALRRFYEVCADLEPDD